MSLPGLVAFVTESAVIPAPIDRVWAAVGALTFSWWTLVEKVEGDFGRVGTHLTFTFKDHSVFIYRVTEISLEKKRLVLDLVQCKPEPVGFEGMMHTIELIEITATRETLMRWTTDFSASVSLAALSDSKLKKLDAFRDLSKSLH